MARNNTNPGKAEAAEERRQKAMHFRKLGMPYRQIGKMLVSDEHPAGVSEAQAHRDVQAVLKRIRSATNLEAEDLVTLEIERLDMALTKIAAQVAAGNLFAVDRWIKLSESRRKLLGLDRPLKAELTGKDGAPLLVPQITEVVINKEIRGEAAGE